MDRGENWEYVGNLQYRLTRFYDLPPSETQSSWNTDVTTRAHLTSSSSSSNVPTSLSLRDYDTSLHLTAVASHGGSIALVSCESHRKRRQSFSHRGFSFDGNSHDFRRLPKETRGGGNDNTDSDTNRERLMVFSAKGQLICSDLLEIGDEPLAVGWTASEYLAILLTDGTLLIYRSLGSAIFGTKSAKIREKVLDLHPGERIQMGIVQSIGMAALTSSMRLFLSTDLDSVEPTAWRLADPTMLDVTKFPNAMVLLDGEHSSTGEVTVVLAHPDHAGVILINAEEVDCRMLEITEATTAEGSFQGPGNSPETNGNIENPFANLNVEGVIPSNISSSSSSSGPRPPIVDMCVHPGGSMIGCYLQDMTVVMVTIDFQSTLMHLNLRSFVYAQNPGRFSMNVDVVKPLGMAWSGSDLALILTFANPDWAHNASGFIVIDHEMNRLTWSSAEDGCEGTSLQAIASEAQRLGSHQRQKGQRPLGHKGQRLLGHKEGQPKPKTAGYRGDAGVPGQLLTPLPQPNHFSSSSAYPHNIILCQESDGVRIVTSEAYYCWQRVPEVTGKIFSPGAFSTAAILLDIEERLNVPESKSTNVITDVEEENELRMSSFYDQSSNNRQPSSVLNPALLAKSSPNVNVPTNDENTDLANWWREARRLRQHEATLTKLVGDTDVDAQMESLREDKEARSELVTGISELVKAACLDWSIPRQQKLLKAAAVGRRLLTGRNHERERKQKRRRRKSSGKTNAGRDAREDVRRGAREDVRRDERRDENHSDDDIVSSCSSDDSEFEEQVDDVVAEFQSACSVLRILNALRWEASLPLSYSQYCDLTEIVVINRLLHRSRHHLAIKLCKHLKLPVREVLIHWACTLIRITSCGASALHGGSRTIEGLTNDNDQDFNKDEGGFKNERNEKGKLAKNYNSEHDERADGAASSSSFGPSDDFRASLDKEADRLHSLIRAKLSPFDTRDTSMYRRISEDAFARGHRRLAWLLLQHVEDLDSKISGLLAMNEYATALQLALLSQDTDILMLVIARAEIVLEPIGLFELLKAFPSAGRLSFTLWRQLGWTTQGCSNTEQQAMEECQHTIRAFKSYTQLTKDFLFNSKLSYIFENWEVRPQPNPKTNNDTITTTRRGLENNNRVATGNRGMMTSNVHTSPPNGVTGLLDLAFLAIEESCLGGSSSGVTPGGTSGSVRGGSSETVGRIKKLKEAALWIETALKPPRKILSNATERRFLFYGKLIAQQIKLLQTQHSLSERLVGKSLVHTLKDCLARGEMSRAAKIAKENGMAERNFQTLKILTFIEFRAWNNLKTALNEKRLIKIVGADFIITKLVEVGKWKLAGKVVLENTRKGGTDREMLVQVLAECANHYEPADDDEQEDINLVLKECGILL
eukprot:g2299.t1